MKLSALHVARASSVALGASPVAASAAWEPVRPVEFIVPAGTGGADQMPRTLPGIVSKHRSKQEGQITFVQRAAAWLSPLQQRHNRHASAPRRQNSACLLAYHIPNCSELSGSNRTALGRKS